MASQRKVNRLEDLLVEEVSIVDRPANRRPFLVVKDQKGVELEADENGDLVPVDKAVWSASFVNDLPDSSFLWIGPGGKKDSDGKTVPRTLRKFPVKDQNGKVDLPHLRNAIARIPQSDIPAADKRRLQDKARSMLAQTTKTKKNDDSEPINLEDAIAEMIEVQKQLTISSELRSDMFRTLGDVIGRVQSVLMAADGARLKEGDWESTLIPVLAAELQEVGKVIKDMTKRLSSMRKSDPEESTDDLDSLISRIEEQVEKRRMGKGRLGKFKQAIGVLQAILSELESPSKDSADVDASAGAAGGSETKKSEVSAEEVTVSKAHFEELTSSIEKLTSVVAKQGKELRVLREVRPSSNSIPVDDATRVVKNECDVAWPMDMNDEKSRDKVDKAISFHGKR